MAWTLIGNIKGPGGNVGATGPVGPTGAIAIATPGVPSRTLNSTFTPNASKPTDCSYPISMTVTATLLAGQTGTVELRSDTNSPPTTVRASFTATIGLGVALSMSFTQTLRWIVPAGYNVRLVSSGTATSITIGAAQTETVLN